MPCVSDFYGVAIYMYYSDHAPPHFHAEYGGDEVEIEIQTLQVLRGGLKRRAMGLVLEWAALHHKDCRYSPFTDSIKSDSMTKPTRIQSVELQGGFAVRLGLTDGSTKTVDLEQYLRGPIFEAIRSNPAEFARVRVDQRAGTIVWPNGADIDPDVLCQGLTPCWSDEQATQSTLW
jgi:hypothetical protein